MKLEKKRGRKITAQKYINGLDHELATKRYVYMWKQPVHRATTHLSSNYQIDFAPKFHKLFAATKATIYQNKQIIVLMKTLLLLSVC